MAHDDPQVEEEWCAEARASVVSYLSREGVAHGRVGEWPAWHVVPYASIWAIESATRPDHVGWWVISGDLPTDYVSAESIKHPRTAMAAVAERWSRYVAGVRAGSPPEDLRVGDGSKELVDLLEKRASILARWARDDSVWAEPE